MIRRLLGDDLEKDERRRKKEILTQHTLMEEAKHSVQILLAEDNPMNQKLAKFMLEKAGYQLVVANNGQEAYDKFVSDPEGGILFSSEPAPSSVPHPWSRSAPRERTAAFPIQSRRVLRVMVFSLMVGKPIFFFIVNTFHGFDLAGPTCPGLYA